MNPYPKTFIYVTESVESYLRMISQNRKMQEEENKIASKVNAFLKYVRVTKCGSSFAKLFAATSKIPNNTKTSEDHSDPLLQVILSLSTGAIKDAFYHIGGNIGEFSNQKKRTVAVEILRKWGRIIVGIGACVFF